MTSGSLVRDAPVDRGREVKSSVATRVAVARTAAPFVAHRNGGWRGESDWDRSLRGSGAADVGRSGRPVGRSDRTFLLCRPSPRPPYRACRPNSCRYGSRGRPRAANDVAHKNSAADLELVLCDEVGDIDRVIAGADVIHIEDSASRGGAVVRRRPIDLRARGSTHSNRSMSRSVDIIAAVVQSSAGGATLATGMGSLAPSSPRTATSGSAPAISRRLP